MDYKQTTETQIGVIKGFYMSYNTRVKRFYLRDKEGQELGNKETQDAIETLAAKMAKQSFPLPIKAIEASNLKLRSGRITSVNPDDRTAYFSLDEKSGYYSHTKVRLNYSHVFERTEKNEKTMQLVEQYHLDIKRVEDKIEELIKELEKPIDLAYFGLKVGYMG